MGSKRGRYVKGLGSSLKQENIVNFELDDTQSVEPGAQLLSQWINALGTYICSTMFCL